MTWCCMALRSFSVCLQEAQREGGAKGRRGFFEILKGGFVRKKPEMADHGERDLLQGNTRYRKLQDLNEGTFGVVMLALDTHAREQVAIKFLERGAGESCFVIWPSPNSVLGQICNLLPHPRQLPCCKKLTRPHAKLERQPAELQPLCGRGMLCMLCCIDVNRRTEAQVVGLQRAVGAAEGGKGLTLSWRWSLQVSAEALYERSSTTGSAWRTPTSCSLGRSS